MAFCSGRTCFAPLSSKAGDAIELITKPLEDIVKGVDGVEHVYSNTQDDSVVVTARFFVGTDEDTALTRIHEKIRNNIADLPKASQCR
jgi:multidrug efflux pump subunit AcrB